MVAFVRKNLLAVTASFFETDGCPVATQPSGVNAQLSYRNTAGQPATANVALSYNSTTKVWSATWDTSVVKEGRVEWVLYSSGSVVAAQEGSFTVVANKANVV